jgi:hypothetical protein
MHHPHGDTNHNPHGMVMAPLRKYPSRVSRASVMAFFENVVKFPEGVDDHIVRAATIHTTAERR